MLSFEPQGRGGLTTLEKGLSYWRINGQKINPMQVWLSSLSPCCLKPGDRRCLQTGGRGCLLSKVRYELVLVSERTCEFSRQAFSRSLVQFKQGKDRLDCSLVLLPLGVKTFLTGVPFTLLLLAGSTCSLHQPIFGFKNRMYISIESAPFWYGSWKYIWRVAHSNEPWRPRWTLSTSYQSSSLRTWRKENGAHETAYGVAQESLLGSRNSVIKILKRLPAKP